jgi:hypothetical protein
VVAVAALIIGWAFFGARALHASWAPAPTVTLILVGGLLALSRSFNVDVRFRSPRDRREERFVHRLRILNGIGAVGAAIAVIWLLIASSGDLVTSFVLPLTVFCISLVLQGISAVRYRPFLIEISNA